jgi:hypothetical protein
MPSSKPIATSDRIKLPGDKKEKVVYVGPRGGKYIKIKGEYVSLKKSGGAPPGNTASAALNVALEHSLNKLENNTLSRTEISDAYTLGLSAPSATRRHIRQIVQHTLQPVSIDTKFTLLSDILAHRNPTGFSHPILARMFTFRKPLSAEANARLSEHFTLSTSTNNWKILIILPILLTDSNNKELRIDVYITNQPYDSILEEYSTILGTEYNRSRNPYYRLASITGTVRLGSSVQYKAANMQCTFYGNLAQNPLIPFIDITVIDIYNMLQESITNNQITFQDRAGRSVFLQAALDTIATVIQNAQIPIKK